MSPPMLLAVLDWNAIIIALISAVPATVAAFMGYTNRRMLKTPSGDPLGHVVERGHDLAAIAVAALTGTEARPGLARSVERINNDPQSPVTVNEQEGGPGAEGAQA